MEAQDIVIKMTFKSHDGTLLYVNYNATNWAHDCFDSTGFLGKIRLRELFFANYRCIEKTFKL